MTQQMQQRDIERILDGWFETGPSRASDRVLVVAADRIHGQPQRPAWLVEWHWSTVSTPIKIALVAAAMAVAAIGSAMLIAGRNQSVPPPSAQPAFQCDDSSPCAGNLAAGSHTSSLFQPALSYQVPAGWRNLLDNPNYYIVDTLDIPAPAILVMSNAAIADQDPTCPARRQPGVGNTLDDWISFLTTHPGLVATDARRMVLAGRDAFRVSLTLSDTWKGNCGDPLMTAVSLITDANPVPTRQFWIGNQEESTMTIVHVDGEIVIAVVQSAFVEIHQRQLEAALPVLETFRFGSGD